MFTTVLLVKKIKMLTLSHGPKTPLVACVFYLVLILPVCGSMWTGIHVFGTCPMRKATTFQQCCHGHCCCAMHMLTCWCSTVHGIISPAEKISQNKCLHRGPVRSISMKVLSVVSPALHTVFTKHPKTRNNKAENGSIFGRGNNKTPTLKRRWRKPTINTLSLDG